MDYPVHNILITNIAYYKNLSEEGRERFLFRVERFMEEKEFEGRGKMEITQVVKVLISACAVQLTFGLENFLFKHFKKILVYPDKFFSPFSRTMNVGEVNMGGIIVLSWKAFEEGIRNPSDSYNVALHEMAHALNFSDLLGKDIDSEFSQYYDKWYVYARKILINRKAKERSFLRKYAGKNFQEFFAVGVEHFFEQPKEFFTRFPELYRQFSYLLNQDPLQKDNLIVYTIHNEKPFHKGERALKSFKPAKSNSKLTFELLSPAVFMGVMWYMLSMNIITIAIGVFIITRSYIRLRKHLHIDIYSNCLSIKSPHKIFASEKKYFPESIVSVNFSDNEEGYTLHIANYNQGQIIHDSVDVYSDFESFFPFFKYLYDELHIAVKHNGQIFIPHKEPAKKETPLWRRLVGV